jgi:hypothetical protein
MKYQDGAQARQAGTQPRGRTDANINPATGLATDYLNHFNEAIMLLEMLASCPECRADFLNWRPLSYREHFAASRFQGRAAAIAAYDAADADLRARLEALTAAMTATLETTRAAMLPKMAPQSVAALALRAAARLKPLVARAGAVINGEGAGNERAASTPQAVVDGLMKT